MNKKLLSITLTLVLLVGLLAACSKPGDAGNSNGERNLNQLYTDAINDAGGEAVEYNPVVTNEDELDEYLLMLVGLQNVSVDALAMSVSMMNVKAYGIVAAMPSAGSEQAVQDGLQSFVDTQRTNFEHYLPDQYDIALNARLEVLSDGTVLMVMCEDSDTVFQNIKSAIEGD